MKILVTDREGKQTEIDGEEGWSLMEAIRGAGLPIAAECGGCCICSTCHVYVDADWLSKLPEPTAEETQTISDGMELKDNSRLSCQISLTSDYDGIKVTLAPTW